MHEIEEFLDDVEDVRRLDLVNDHPDAIGRLGGVPCDVTEAPNVVHQLV